MGLNNKIRNRIGNYLFNKEFAKSKRQRGSISFQKARTIGIIYDATEERNYEIVKAYVKRLRDDFKKDVLALGYYNGLELPPMRFAKLGMDFLPKKSLNWHYKPSHPMVSKFINTGFDILIHLNLEKSFPLKYICALTNAKFKIGKFEKNQHVVYDFMIKPKEKLTLMQMIDLVNHYLHLIADEQPQAV
ncbi:MAG: hypothetical protein IPJ79_09245 [Bacteroidetes bacterium]|nr:hypothetical protein [Bacteroidota bacterium]